MGFWILTRPSGAFPQRGEASSPVSSADDSSICSSTGGTSISISSPEDDEDSIGTSSAECRATTCFVLAIKEGAEVEQVEEEIWRKNPKSLNSSEERGNESWSEQSGEGSLGFEILRIRAPHSEGVLMRLLNAYFCRRFVNKRLSQQAFNSKIRVPHSAGVLINWTPP